MPTTYAHYYFGCLVYDVLDSDIQELVNKHRAYYDYGVHGPDIFFYHDPLHPKKDKFYIFANKLHDHSGRYFFQRQKENFMHTAYKEETLAYLLGFLTHFILDSVCHSYIEKVDASTDCSHYRIEAELDRYLLERNGRTPAYKQDITTHLQPSSKMATVYAGCFPQFSSGEMLILIKRMVSLLKFLQDPNDLKKPVLKKICTSKKLQNFYDMFMTHEEDARLTSANMRLEKLFDKALLQAPRMVDQLLNYLDSQGELSDDFDLLFGYNPGWEEIPFLTPEEEADYVII